MSATSAVFVSVSSFVEVVISTDVEFVVGIVGVQAAIKAITSNVVSRILLDIWLISFFDFVIAKVYDVVIALINEPQTIGYTQIVEKLWRRS